MIVHRKLRHISRYLIIVSIFFLLITGCSITTPAASQEVVINNVQVTQLSPTQAHYAFKTSEPGTITINGYLIVLDPTTMIPAPGDSIYLVPLPASDSVASIPQFTVGEVPQAEVDEITGEFVFTNIKPGQYAVVVITTGGAQIPVRNMTTKTYSIFTLDNSQIDTTVNINELSLP